MLYFPGYHGTMAERGSAMKLERVKEVNEKIRGDELFWH